MRVLIAAGGTAGHINPALAIAGALKAAEPTAEIHFAGRREGMEYGLVTKARLSLPSHRDQRLPAPSERLENIVPQRRSHLASGAVRSRAPGRS